MERKREIRAGAELASGTTKTIKSRASKLRVGGETIPKNGLHAAFCPEKVVIPPHFDSPTALQPQTLNPTLRVQPPDSYATEHTDKPCTPTLTDYDGGSARSLWLDCQRSKDTASGTEQPRSRAACGDASIKFDQEVFDRKSAPWRLKPDG